jgi:hypothetical protein
MAKKDLYRLYGSSLAGKYGTGDRQDVFVEP